MKTLITITTLLVLISCNKEYIIKTKPYEEFIEFEVLNNSPYNSFEDYKFHGTVGEVNKQTDNWQTNIPTDATGKNLEILLGGNSTGNYSSSKENITIKFNSLEFYPYSTTNPLNATITKYEEVGGFIEGTFNGKGMSINNKYDSYNNSTYIDTTYIQFKNGKFKVIRDY